MSLVVQFFGTQCRYRVKSRHSNMWSYCDLYVVGHDGVLCEVKWWQFVELFQQNWISWFKTVSGLLY